MGRERHTPEIGQPSKQKLAEDCRIIDFTSQQRTNIAQYWEIVNIQNKQATLESNNAQSSGETGTGMDADKLPVMAAVRTQCGFYSCHYKPGNVNDLR